ncbi:MAG TPA: iron ABC transporter permease [Luteibaculaceae bacterium]|nr:iron ABC transporter permease [Luteibaculaceae bacterium]
MTKNKRFYLSIAVLVLLTVSLLIVGLCRGPVSIPLDQVLRFATQRPLPDTQFLFILEEIRLPRVLTAFLAGGAISVSGLLMQTYFRNPLAGPFVLGISSGASLGVALLIFVSSALPFLVQLGYWGIVSASFLGSTAVMLLTLVVAQRVVNSSSLLIIGLMFGSFTSAVVSLLQFASSPELIQRYVFWTFGSLSGVNWPQIGLLAALVAVGMLAAFAIQKNLNLLLLGETYARSMGLRVKRNRTILVFATCVLAGSVTAFCGPIAFLGLAVPHFSRVLMADADHKKLLPITFLVGAVLLMICDQLSYLPFAHVQVPINALTSLIGAPAVVAIIVKRRNL